MVAFSAGVGTDGTVSNTHALPGAALVSAAHAHGLKVHLCATLFDSSGGNEIATFLGSAAAQSKAVSQLLAIATSSGLDGLNLDFEFVPSGSRAQFTAFVQKLHAALRFALPAAEVTLAMPASTGYTGYDAKGLAAVSERLLLMEYDYHWRTALTSGANAPLPSVESAVGGFLAVAPASAIAMGVPYYGYDWPTATASPGSANSTGGATVLFADVFGKFSTYGRPWDSASQTPWYQYSLSGQEHQGWVDDGQSLALKYQFVNATNLAGIMIWALGYDAGRTESWDAIKTAFGNGPPPQPSVPGALRLVSATFSPATLPPGGAVTARLRVKNVGGQTVGAVAPPPSAVYDESQGAASAARDTWRVAVDVADRLRRCPRSRGAGAWRRRSPRARRWILRCGSSWSAPARARSGPRSCTKAWTCRRTTWARPSSPSRPSPPTRAPRLATADPIPPSRRSVAAPMPGAVPGARSPWRSSFSPGDRSGAAEHRGPRPFPARA